MMFGAANAFTGETDRDKAIARFIAEYPDEAKIYYDQCHRASEPPPQDSDDADAWELIRSAAEELRAAEPALSFDEAVTWTLAQDGQ